MEVHAGDQHGLHQQRSDHIGGGGGESSKSMMAQQKIQSLDFFTQHLYEKIVLDLMAVDHWEAASAKLVVDPDVFDVKNQINFFKKKNYFLFSQIVEIVIMQLVRCLNH